MMDGRCLGRSFAITNVKILLAVLMRSFTFELAGGRETKIVTKFTLANRPKAEDEEGFALRMIVKRIES
jgi:cytochrome P450